MANQNALQPLRVLQITDSHLFRSTDGKLLGMNTEQSLARVMELIEHEQVNPDLVLATGDISQDGTPESYNRFHEWMRRFQCPVYWLPGNHDLTEVMAQNQATDHMSPCIIRAGEWRIIMLDSSVRGEVPGNFSERELTFLDGALQQCEGQPTMVAMHHQPVAVGCAWLDQQIIGNASQFFQVIDRSRDVKAVIWGHVHQDFTGERRGVKLMSSPSTCIQFQPNSNNFAVDSENPGYRWFDLYPDGRIDSGVSRVPGVGFVVDYNVKGY